MIKNKKIESDLDSEQSYTKEKIPKSILTNQIKEKKYVRFAECDEEAEEAAYGKYNLKGSSPNFGYMPQTWTRPTYTILNDKEYLENEEFDWVRNTLLNKRRLPSMDKLSNKRKRNISVTFADEHEKV